jgi:hypothetical protein
LKPFPPLEQIAFLLGAELQVVSLGRYQVSLIFDSEARITIEHFLEYRDRVEVERYDVQKGMGPVRFHELLLETVTQLDVEDWRLTLTFGSNRALTIPSIAGPYESGQIAIGGDRAWVF